MISWTLGSPEDILRNESGGHQSWANAKDGVDVYHVTCEYPVGSDAPSKTVKEVVFDGVTPQTLEFPDERMVLTVRADAGDD